MQRFLIAFSSLSHLGASQETTAPILSACQRISPPGQTRNSTIAHRIIRNRYDFRDSGNYHVSGNARNSGGAEVHFLDGRMVGLCRRGSIIANWIGQRSERSIVCRKRQVILSEELISIVIPTSGGIFVVDSRIRSGYLANCRF